MVGNDAKGKDWGREKKQNKVSKGRRKTVMSVTEHELCDVSEG